jgi:hypothetical protein
LRLLLAGGVVVVLLDDSRIRAAKAMLASGAMSAIEVAHQLGCAASTLDRAGETGRRVSQADRIGLPWLWIG